MYHEGYAVFPGSRNALGFLFYQFYCVYTLIYNFIHFPTFYASSQKISITTFYLLFLQIIALPTADLLKGNLIS